MCRHSFDPYLDTNQRTKKPIFHVSLNPHPEDVLDKNQLQAIASEYMERMGYGEQPYIVYEHKDIDRTHLHIVSVRVDRSGRKLEHDFEAKKSMDILREIEKGYGLHPAVKGEELADKPAKKVDYERGNVKQQLSSVVREILNKYYFASATEFNTLLNLQNVSVEEVRGEINGKPYAGVIYGALNDQ